MHTALSRRRLLQTAALASLAPRVPCLATDRITSSPGRGVTDTSRSPFAQLRALDMTAVSWKPGFWQERYDLMRRKVVFTMWKMINLPENGASFVTFRIAAGAPKQTTYATPYSDGDCYKWVEGAAHLYTQDHDPQSRRAIKALIDEAVAIIARAQAPDGYISTPVQIRNNKRWSDIRNLELYNMGHLMTAACIHYRATGEDTLLDVARRAADYLCATFLPPKAELAHFSSNPAQIMGLAEMYRTTGKKRYLDLAEYFIDDPGRAAGGSDDRQDRVPLRRETEAVGHAVIGPYLYAGAADALAEQKDAALSAALERIWEDVTYRKMYLTGGVGAQHVGFALRPNPQGELVKTDLVNEAFAEDYDLPSRTAYNETCANIANAIWNWRMLTLTGDPRHAEIMERVFYNSMLSGVSLEGTEYFYSNPLRRDARAPLARNDTAVRWANTASRRAANAPWAPACCCPSNAFRTLSSLHEYAFSHTNGALWVHLYGASEVLAPVTAGTAHFVQTTEYPWQGTVVFQAGPQSSGSFALRLRIPEWAAGSTVHVNGTPAPGEIKPSTYFEIAARAWKPGDRVELKMPMEPRRVVASARLDDTRGQVAVMRGPLVYCLESNDLPAGHDVDDILLLRTGRLTARHEPALLGGVTTVVAEARSWKRSPGLYGPMPALDAAPLEVRLVPYYSWANRGVSSMSVWMPVA